MSKTKCLALGILVVLLSTWAPRSFANQITGVVPNVTCSSYGFTVSEDDLVIGQTYTLQWYSNFMPTGVYNPAIEVANTYTFTATASTLSQTITEPLGPLYGNYTGYNNTGATPPVVGDSGAGEITLFSGTKQWNSMWIDYPPLKGCPAPPPPPTCQGTNTNASNFNGTPIADGNYVWFDAIFTASGIPSTGATINFTNSTITYTIGEQGYGLLVPNAQITFSPTASCSSTTYNSSTNTWDTIVPVKGDDEIFLTGLAIPAPIGGFPGGVSPVDWNGSFSVTPNNSGVQIKWQWGAAAYSSFTTNYNALGIKAGHQTACGQNNGDHAGTPEGVNSSNVPWKNYVIGGARGGGGSNWTGSWSGTNSVPLACTAP